MSDLIISTPLDQPTDRSKEQTDAFLQQINSLILSAVREKNANKAFDVLLDLRRMMELSGLALAKALALIEQHWEEFEIDDDFYNTIMSVTGLSKETVYRYIAVEHMRKIVPPELLDVLYGRNIKDLIPIAYAIEQGYEITNDIWQELADAPDLDTVSSIIRDDVKEKPPRKNLLQLILDPFGSIYVWQNGESEFVGSLETDNDHPAVKAAIKRILKSARIIEQ